MDELKPCPFCGAQVSTVTGWTNRGGKRVTLVRVRCYFCDASGPTAEGEDSDGLENEAVELWNTRPGDTP